MPGSVLRVISPGGEVRIVPLTGADLQIGSSIESSLVLAGNGVSGQHCRIELRGQKLTVVDRASKNGTFVNSRRCVEPTEIHEGDRIGVGTYILEVAPQRTAADVRQVEQKLRAAPVKLGRDDVERRAVERERLRRYAGEWHSQGRPRRLLLHARDLAAARAWPEDERSADPTLAALIEATTRAQRLRLALGLGLAGAVLAGGMITWVALGNPDGRPGPGADPPRAAAAETPVPKDSQPSTTPGTGATKLLVHEVRPGETYEDIAHYYGVSLPILQHFNTVALGEAPVVGTPLRVPTDKPLRPPLEEERYLVSPGDTWRTIAGYYDVPVTALRRQNPDLGDQLRDGDELRFLVEREPFAAASPNPDDLPIFIVPQGASSEGKVTGGTLRNAVQLLPSDLCQVRCAVHSFATGFTIKALLQAVAEYRRQGYTGDLMIGDLSRRDGGQYGPHKSHQSGRDADIWLLPKGKVYKSGCNSCGTPLCRPEPEDVDWAAQWRFIQALDAGGLVKEIFLSWRLHENLHKAAVAQGASKEELKRMIQWPRKPGVPALVMHSEGHVHHIHVRFKCDPTDLACSDLK